MKTIDKKSYAYKKYVKPSKDREKSLKKSRRLKWWADNWIALSGLVIAIIALIVALIK